MDIQNPKTTVNITNHLSTLASMQHMLKNGSHLGSLKPHMLTEGTWYNCRYTTTAPQTVDLMSRDIQNGIKVLDLSVHTKLTDKELIETISKCPNLQQLDISSCEAITSKGLIEALALLPKLKKLNINACSTLDHTIIPVLAQHKNLEDLELDLNITSTQLAELASEESVLSLKRFKYTPPGMGEWGAITDNLIQAFASKFGPSLEELNLFDARDLTDASLYAIAQHCPNLKAINFSHNFEGFTPAGMITLMTRYQNLQKVDLSYCVSCVNDDVIHTLIANNQGTLQSLSIDGCTNTTAAAVTALSTCPNLGELNARVQPQYI